MYSWFNTRKAAQLAAFFALKEGGTINLLKLVKLIYLANRGAMAKYDYPLIDDYLVSMKNGPVNSTVYSFINGEAGEDQQDWEEFVTGRSGYNIGLRHRKVSPKELDELSEADLGILRKVWEQFGHMDEWALVRYTHRNCPEWEDPGASSSPIPYERVFKALGKKQSQRLALMIDERRQIERTLSN